MGLSKQEIELFLLFPDLKSKTSFTKYFPMSPKSPKPVLQTGNGIISQISRPQICSLISKDFKNVFKIRNRIIETGNGFASPLF